MKKPLNKFQQRISTWMLNCFNLKIANDVNERNHRFLEESLELVQSLGTTKEEALILVNYVFDRELGEPYQEVGGVMVTLGALCNAVTLDMDGCAELELTRIEQPEIMNKIRLKQLSKPTSSPLPQRKELNTGKATILEVEVPEGSRCFSLHHDTMMNHLIYNSFSFTEKGYVVIPDEEFEIIGIACEITEEQSNELAWKRTFGYWHDYTKPNTRHDLMCSNPLDSWHSFMTAHQINPNSLILKKVE